MKTRHKRSPLFFFGLLLILCLQGQQGSAQDASSTAAAPAEALSQGATLPKALITNDLKIDSLELRFPDGSGKWLLIDFWATWCAPCVAGHRKLDSLQAQFSESLHIWAVSYEETSRVRRFVEKQPATFQHVRDEHELFATYFPHRIIPHAVLIDPSGQIRSISAPEDLDAFTLQAFLSGEEPRVAQKQDRIGFDPLRSDIFERSGTEEEAFTLIESLEGLPTLSIKGLGEGLKGRRLTLINYSISGMIREAMDLGWRRFQIKEEEKQALEEELYTLDLIVAEADSDLLRTQLFEHVQTHFGLTLDTLRETSKIYRLVLEDPVKRAQHAAVNPEEAGASGQHYRSPAAQLKDLADYLEQFGIVGAIVLPETETDPPYPMDFRFFPEDVATFWKALEALGLGLRQEEAEVTRYQVSLKKEIASPKLF